MTIIRLFDRTGPFAENKDVARELRLKELMPALQRGEDVVVDFSGVEAATQSFVHALISDAIRKHGGSVLDRLAFKACSEPVKKIVAIVTDYMQEGLGPG